MQLAHGFKACCDQALCRGLYPRFDLLFEIGIHASASAFYISVPLLLTHSPSWTLTAPLTTLTACLPTAACVCIEPLAQRTHIHMLRLCAPGVERLQLSGPACHLRARLLATTHPAQRGTRFIARLFFSWSFCRLSALRAAAIDYFLVLFIIIFAFIGSFLSDLYYILFGNLAMLVHCLLFVD